jgi:hypothetical protein
MIVRMQLPAGATKVPFGEKPDFSNVPRGAAKELCRQGELCLQGTVQLAIALDQRATTLTGVVGAAYPTDALLTSRLLSWGRRIAAFAVVSGALVFFTVLLEV